jgi:hypothetical protein
MLGVYDRMKKFINKCELYFEGHIISKELLLQNYADFLASNFAKKHNVVISLHTSSICFDIITVLFSALSNIMYDQGNADEFIKSLKIGDKVQCKNKMYIFDGFDNQRNYLDQSEQKCVRLVSYSISNGDKCNCVNFIYEKEWNLIKPCHGNAKQPGRTIVHQDISKRNDFLSSVFEMSADEIPSFTEKSSVIVNDMQLTTWIPMPDDCMAPEIQKGDRLGLWAYPRGKENPIPGKIYALDTMSNGTIVRYLYLTPEGDYLLRSQNPTIYPDFVVKKSDVIAVYKKLIMVRI